MIVLVEESTIITCVNETNIPKGQWHRLQGPLRLCKEYLEKKLYTKMEERDELRGTYQCNAQVPSTETANSDSKIRDQI